MKKVLSSSNGFLKKIKEKLFTKREVEHSERFNKTIDILNNYYIDRNSH